MVIVESPLHCLHVSRIIRVVVSEQQAAPPRLDSPAAVRLNVNGPQLSKLSSRDIFTDETMPICGVMGFTNGCMDPLFIMWIESYQPPKIKKGLEGMLQQF